VSGMSGSRFAVARLAGAAFACILGVACGDGGDGDDDTGDAGTVDRCTMSIAVSPAAPVAPESVELEGSIIREGYPSGVESFQFAVIFDGTVVAVSDLDPYDGSRVSFQAQAPGPYRVELSGSIGDISCTDALEFVNVVDSTADHDTYRIRFAPAVGQPAPIQERVYSIPGGADYSIGTIGLDSGVEVSGYVTDASASPLAAYLRVLLVGSSAPAAETFADDAGAFSARLAAGSYDVLVVPDSNSVAPALLDGLALSALGLLTITAGDVVTGVVLDPAGAPLAGALVSLRIDDVPSAIATTDAGGAFAVLARVGGATALTVNPPAGSGLPRLELTSDEGLVAAPAVPLTVRYSAALSARAVTLDLMRSDGTTPAGGARVTFVARAMASAGTVTPEGGAAVQASGELRVSAEADAGGAIPTLQLPETLCDAIVEPSAALAAEAVRLIEVDLSAGQTTPASLSLAAPATLSGQAVDTAQAGLAGVQVTAVPRGLLANVARASATATTDATGAFSLSVVGAGEYDLLLEPRGASHARTQVTGVAAPVPGQTSTVPVAELPTAIALSGRVEIPGVAGGAAGVHVMALCYDCTGAAASAPVADAVTDVSGSFLLAIPDPGVGE